MAESLRRRTAGAVPSSSKRERREREPPRRYFFAEPKQNRDFPSEVVLAINAKGILVVDPESKEFLQEYPYTQVVTWGHSANSFVVVTGNAVNQKKVYFKTEQGKEMNVMVRAYVEALVP